MIIEETKRSLAVRAGAAAVILALAGSACGGQTKAGSPSAQPPASSIPAGSPAPGTTGGATPASSSKATSPAAASSAPTGVPSFKTDPSVIIHASVSPSCVKPGEVVTLTVKTNSEASVGYQAAYSDGNAGTKPPYGAGYGGNDQGFADKSGTYRSVWTLTANAPAGRASVEIIVGWRGKLNRGATAFAVAGPSGHC